MFRSLSDHHREEDGINAFVYTEVVAVQFHRLLRHPVLVIVFGFYEVYSEQNQSE